MATNSTAADSYLFRSLTVMVGIVVIYVTLGDPHPMATGAFSILFVCGAIITLASPTRWPTRTTLRMYQVVPLLVGTSFVANGIFYLIYFDLPMFTVLLFGWGVLSLIAFGVMPWDEVLAYLEQVNASENDVDDPVAPLPERLLLQSQYAIAGVLAINAAVVAFRLLWSPDFGQASILSTVGVAGFVNVWCSPFSGSPGRIVRLRQVRWGVLGLGAGTSSLYGFLLTDAQAPAAFWGAVALGIGYWLYIQTDWEAVREEIAELQANTRTEW